MSMFRESLRRTCEVCHSSYLIDITNHDSPAGPAQAMTVEDFNFLKDVSEFGWQAAAETI